jgi:hypothetical protein
VQYRVITHKPQQDGQCNGFIEAGSHQDAIRQQLEKFPEGGQLSLGDEIVFMTLSCRHGVVGKSTKKGSREAMRIEVKRHTFATLDILINSIKTFGRGTFEVVSRAADNSSVIITTDDPGMLGRLQNRELRAEAVKEVLQQG